MEQKITIDFLNWLDYIRKECNKQNHLLASDYKKQLTWHGINYGVLKDADRKINVQTEIKYSPVRVKKRYNEIIK